MAIGAKPCETLIRSSIHLRHNVKSVPGGLPGKVVSSTFRVLRPPPEEGTHLQRTIAIRFTDAQGDDGTTGGRGRTGGGNYRAPSASSQPSGAAPNGTRLKHGVHGAHPSKHTTPSVKWTSKDKAGPPETNNVDGRDANRTFTSGGQHHIKIPVIRKFSLSGTQSEGNLIYGCRMAAKDSSIHLRRPTNSGATLNSSVSAINL
ncbi:neuropeptides capa receptor-like [Tropilaelaps mercedesae]|uniref:Neuropeptides capa receptor-like n=1 Tax=Tropilaelaps mercedesae TaxID=418985 RepID=A0A1V9Y2S3_9ACAR|nr:neuropeptides capa receptor-like [Tropilaelaps mercedesae]